ncbi:MAG: carboxypeptidase-like regulatory domain-containing protein [Planctomycetota bacterium]
MAAPSSEPTWQSRARKQGHAKLSRHLKRACIVALLASLCVLFALLILPPFFTAQTHVVLIGISPSKTDDLPPVAYVEEDLRSLLGIENARADDLSATLPNARSATRIGDALESKGKRTQDTLVMYITAHGLIDESGAYLACDDFDLRKPSQGRLPVRELLEQIRRARARTKFVVINAGAVANDPRLGIHTNDFATRLRQAVIETGDPSLWVYCSHASTQQSHSIDSARRTVFGGFLSAGLKGAADLNRNGEIGIDELVRFTTANVSKWVSSSTARAAEQTPQLTWGGDASGSATRPDPVLLSLDPSEKVWTAAHVFSSEEAATKANSEANDQADVTLVSRSIPAPSAGTLLTKAWESLDHSDSRQTELETAPHRLRESRHRLLALDQRIRFGSSDEKADALSELEELVVRLETPETPSSKSKPSSSVGAKTVASLRNDLLATLKSDDPKLFDEWFKTHWTKQLAEDSAFAFIRSLSAARQSANGELSWELVRLASETALIAEQVAAVDAETPGWIREDVDCGDRYRLFAQHLIEHRTSDTDRRRTERLLLEARRCYDDAERRVTLIREAADERDRSLFVLPELLRLQCESSFNGSGLDTELSTLIENTRKLCERLQQLSPQDVEDIELLIKAARASRQRIDAAHGNGLAKEIRRRQPTATSLQNAKRLLSSNLLETHTRHGLSEWVQQAERELLNTYELADAGSVDGQDGGLQADVWPVLMRNAELQTEYASLCRILSFEERQSEVAVSLEKLQVALTEIRKTRDGQRSWKPYQEYGRSLRAFYNALVQNVGSFENDATVVTQKVCSLRFLDPRDAWRFQSVDTTELTLASRWQSHGRWQAYRDWQSATFAEQPRSTLPDLVVPVLEEVSSIELQDSRSQVIRIRLRNPTNQPVETRLAMDFDAKALGVEWQGAADDYREMSRTSYGSRQTPVIALPEMGFVDLELRVSRKAGACRSSRIVCDLLAARSPALSQGPAPVLGRRSIQVRLPVAELFVKHGARNYTSDERGMTLLPFPNRTDQFRFGVTGHDLNGRSVELNLYQATESTTLPIDVKALPSVVGPRVGQFTIISNGSDVAFPGAGKEEGKAKSPKKADDPKPTPPVSLDCSHGLLAEIRDHETGQTTYRIVNFAVQRPRRFVKLDVRYDASREQVAILASATDPSLLPSGVPVRIHCEVPHEFGSVSGKLSGLLSPSKPSTRLFVDTKRLAGATLRLLVHVDDYPRAFVFDVPCEGPSNPIAERTDLVEIKLGLEDDRGVVPPAPSIPVMVAVNAPVGTFELGDDLVEIGYDLDEDGTPDQESLLRRFGDRQVRIGWFGAKPDGSVSIDSAVSDHLISLPSTRLENLAIQVGGRLTVKERSMIAKPIEFFVDSAAPVVGPAKLRQPEGFVKPAADCELFVFGYDESAGIRSVEAAFDTSGTGEFPSEGKVFEGAFVGNGQWRLKVKAGANVGMQTLLIRGTDLVGNVSDPLPFDLDVRLPTEGGPQTLDPQRVLLEGDVRYRGKLLANVEVTLTRVAKEKPADAKQAKPLVAKTDEQGHFSIPNLEPGGYRLMARAVIRNRVHLIDRIETVAAKADGKQRVVLSLP